MSSETATIGALRPVAAALFAVTILATAPLSGALAATPTAGKPAASAKGEATPEKIQELMTLLADPKVRDWLEQESKAQAVQARESEGETNSISHEFDSHVAAVREHIVALGAALPELPNQIESVHSRITSDLGSGGRVKGLLLLALFIGLGFGVEWLFRKATERIRRHLDEHPLETVNDRLRVVATRFAFAVGVVAAFALGSVGAFLALEWPPLLREMVFGYLVVFLVIRVAVVVGHLLLAPHHERFRICPVDTAVARFWSRRIAAFVGLFAFGWVEVGLLSTLGLSLAGRQLIAYVLGLGLLGIALEAIWRRPRAPGVGVEALPHSAYRLGRGAQNALLSIGIVLLWVLWVLHAMMSFWLVLVVITLPLALGVTRRAVQHLLRPAGSHEVGEGPPSVVAISIERGIRALLFIGAAAVLAWGWGIDLVHLAAGEDTLFDRLVHGVLSAVVILLVADVLWHAMKTAIDRKLAESADPGQPSTDEARRRSRLRTLLPIFRNILFVVVITVAVLMALSAMGVPITPLVAGAGVFGIALGFGAQTFARDIIAGMFYLVDDAFRVGEYIQSGN
jgi:small-conductance mechanosensitive channel